MASGHIPGMAIAYVQDGAVAWIEPIGTLTSGGERPVEAGTVFEAASLGKPLLAYGVMRLVERGRMALDAPLGRYLPGRFQGAVRDSAVTVERALTHSSGLDLDATGEGLAITFPPGSRWSYSSVGYALLQRAVENVTGMGLEDWMQQEVIGPLGMTRTSFLATRRKQPGAAVGHDRQGRKLLETPWPVANAAASLHTTAEDYAKFVAAALDAEPMWTRRIVADAPHDLHWGLGWGVAGTQAPVFLQWGSNPGFKSLTMGIPGERRGFVILSNADNGLELATVLAARMVGRDLPALGFFMLHPTD
jgi:CubicO group peptidase (beta-lactamase class C family)